ncbi:uncharacterized protein LOC126837345 isoform X2 [Adelges cooleyi]|uniref:uncharacterized protein LOC126837345 isoform X2 n=1 Tax=Adelges cooleyi TaxID=133065 RepID=UPI00217F7EE0|nr:uncharacterized protein LOC126837345 isoform X2 [Adelges cooleyi]
MQFKSAVIFCALYFVTVTQSVGLNKDQVQKIVIFFKGHGKPISKIPNEGIEKLVDDFGMNNFSDLNYNNGMTYAQKVQDLLVFLANYDKRFDDWWKESILSSYEVKVYMGAFNIYDLNGTHDGLLDFNEVRQVIDVFNLDDADKNRLAAAFDKSDVAINASEFLLGFMREKTEGRGLDVDRIQDLIDLHNNHRTHGDHIDSDKIKEFFKKLSIVKNDHEDQLLDFKSIRTSAFELQELSVVSAEYNKDVDIKAGSVLTTAVVRFLIWQFNTHDDNKNGLLGTVEFKKLSKHHFPNEDGSLIVWKFDTDDDNRLNIAEFFMAIITTYLEAGHNA